MTKDLLHWVIEMKILFKNLINSMIDDALKKSKRHTGLCEPGYDELDGFPLPSS